MMLSGCVPVLMLISVPRTGSSNLLRFLEQQTHIFAKYELFHPKAALSMSAEEISDFAPPDLGLIDLPAQTDNVEFTRFRRANPLKMLNYYQGVAGREGADLFTFKLFRGHLEDEQILGLAARPQVYPVLLKRRWIDTYISMKKASAIQSYRNEDTTSLQITLDAESFVGTSLKLKTWFDTLETALPANTPILSYEALYRHGPQSLRQSISHILAHYGIGAELQLADSLPRQDRAERWQDKISNPQDIEPLVTHHGALFAEPQQRFCP